MRKYYSFVRFNDKTVMPSNALARDVKDGPSVKAFRDMEDPATLVVAFSTGARNVYPWATVQFAREMEAPAEATPAPAPAAKKGKG